jgi:DNA-binding response OmpR family regulator
MWRTVQSGDFPAYVGELPLRGVYPIREDTGKSLTLSVIWHGIFIAHKKDSRGIVPAQLKERTYSFNPNRMKKILVLHGDETVRSTIGMMLEQEDFAPIWAVDAKTALDTICTLKPQLLVIDLPLVGSSAVELCLQLRASNVQTPIIVLSENGEEINKILLLEAGVDDYIVKPFSVRELLARIRALLRRTASHRGRTIRFGDVEIDPDRRVIACRGNEVTVTPCEYNLLLFFVQNADRALTRDALLNSVWGYDRYPNTRTVDAHVSKLRNKFEPNPSTPRHFRTIHGVGYRFVM